VNVSKKFLALREIINSSDNIVFFGGAGVSTESNIPDFRSAKGLYSERTGEGLSPETILSHTYFMNYTRNFYEYYKNKMIYKDAQPNNAHYALAKLEQAGRLRAVITQNIDGLHQKAGSKEVLELHGSVYRNHCMRCNKFFPLDYILESPGVPTCDLCGGIVKPDVVLYEENLDMDILNKSIWYIENAEVLIVAGTSLTVYPAAGLINYFSGEKLVLINKTPTPYDSLADLVINESIGETLKVCITLDTAAGK
jgi:NAD-dependent deacetylase